MKINSSLKSRMPTTDEILKGVDAGLCLINRDMQIVWLNNIMESWFGPSSKLLGKKCYKCFEKKNYLCHGCPVDKAFRDKAAHVSPLRIGITTTGEKRYYQLSATPITNGHGIVEEVLESVIDITQKRKRDIENRKRLIETRRVSKDVIENFKKVAYKKHVELKRANDELKTIYEIGNRLISSLDVNEVLESIVNTVPRFLQASGCVVRILDETKTKLRLEAAFGVSDGFKESAYQLSISEGISGIVARTGSPVAISDISKDKRVRFYNECSREGMRSILATPIKFKNKILGTIVAFSKKAKHFDESEIKLISTFAAHAAIALNNAMLHNNVQLNYYNTITTLVKAMEARDPYTCGHSERVTNYSLKIAKRLKLNKNDVELLVHSGRLHDLGKIAIPDFILKKTTALSRAERAEIEAHPVKGVDMIVHLKFLIKCFPLIRHHHERFDGKGYPDKLKREKIPLLARILSIADAFDAMTSERPYRKGLAIAEAIEEIKRNLETQFDPLLAKLFLSILKEQPTIKTAEEISAGPFAPSS